MLLASVGAAAAPPEPAKYGVFRTDDRGRTWSPAGLGLSDTVRVNAFAANGETLLAGTDAGIYRSTNGGRNWRKSGTAARVLSLAVHGKTAYAGTSGNGLLQSDDAGATWTAAASFPGRLVRSLTVADGTVYAGTDSQGVFASGGLGGAWQPLQGGLPTGAQIFALTSVKGRVFAGLYSKGLYAWDGAWRKQGTVTPLALAADGANLVAGHNPGGIHRSADAGRTWEAAIPGEVPPLAPVWEMGASGTLLLAGAAAGVYYAEDGGRTWLQARTGLPAAGAGISFLSGEKFVLVCVSGRWAGAKPPMAAYMRRGKN